MDSITLAVKDQYEKYPYPLIGENELTELIPPVTSLDFVHYFCNHTRNPHETPLILDAGCGTGFSTLKLAQANPGAKILAFDLSETSLEIAKKRLGKADINADVTFEMRDLSTLDLGQKFDYIHCTGVLHHLNEPAKGFQKISEHLKDQGLAYFIIYSKHARYYVRLIQNVLRKLWKDTSNLKEGVNLCRAFFRGLPDTHPLKLVYYTHKTVIREQFSESFAESDHFLIDTYLQQCERDMDLQDVFAHLKSADLKFSRFLDDDAWKIQDYLPALPDYILELSDEEKYIMVDPLRMDRNYALFVSKQQSERSSLKYQAHDTPHISPVITQTPMDDHLLVDNQMGKQLSFEEAAQFLWAQIDGNSTWETILQKCAQQYGFALEETEEGLRPLLEGLLKNYFVFV